MRQQYEVPKFKQNELDDSKVSTLKCVTCGLPYKNARLLHAHHERFGHGAALLAVKVAVEPEDDYIQGETDEGEYSDTSYKCTYCEMTFDDVDQRNAHESDKH